MNNQSIIIDMRQVIGRSRMFTFEANQKNILAHVHGHCKIIHGGV